VKALFKASRITRSSSKFNLKQINLNMMVRLPFWWWRSRSVSKRRQLLPCWLNHSTELQVWQECDQDGNLSWSSYDPTTKRSIHHICENQMRIWIEQRNHC
jgi:hypothetical protein